MSREQYIKLIEKELHNVNKKIDMKILEGADYRKEARDHKILRKKILQHSRQNFFSNFFSVLLHS
jgi:hypothetical protein